MGTDLQNFNPTLERVLTAPRREYLQLLADAAENPADTPQATAKRAFLLALAAQEAGLDPLLCLGAFADLLEAQSTSGGASNDRD